MNGTLFLVVLVALGGGMQQSRVPAPPLDRDVRVAGNTVETPHVTVTTSVKGGADSPGSRVSLVIEVTPKPKMHVYSPLQKDYIPVSITLKSDPSYRAQQPVFPKPEKYFFEPLKETQLVYSKPFRIVQDITLFPGSADSMTVEGTFRYQACDDAICYLPKTVPVSWTLARKGSSVQ